MKHLKSYKLFESTNQTENFFRDKINWELIETIKDLSLEYLDDGSKLVFIAEISKIDPKDNHRLMIGTFFTKDEPFDPSVEMGEFETRMAKRMRDQLPKDSITFVDLYPNFLKLAIRSWERTNKIKYHFCIYEPGYFNQHREVDTEATKEILGRITGMYPDETISI